MLLRGDDLIGTLKSLSPPLDAETRRELIAVAYGSADGKARALAQKLVAAHVDEHALIRATLGSGFHRANDACTKLRQLEIADRGKLAVALRAHGASVAGVAFEEDEDFARDRLPRLVDKKGVLDLHEWYVTPNQVETLKLTTIPDVVFDELPRLHRKKKFDELVLWGSPATLPKRFVEFAPYVRRLRLGWCGISRLPDVICELTNLELLEVHEPKLVALNPRLKKLKKLKHLTIARAKKLKQLPPEVCELPNLEELGLWFFRMKELPRAMGELTKLRTLDLYGSFITSFPDELAGLPLKQVTVTSASAMQKRLKQLAPKARFR
ncbi:MAG: leucine-rich repeat domain-containing protein [Myxococcaceae bacterium]|nr:leucine-rich repeat domain-containing protein [Myxococcaceae bacterium]